MNFQEYVKAVKAEFPGIKDPQAREIAKLRAENEAIKKQSQPKIGFKVGEKGGLSMTGLGRFPVTLYKDQWETLLANVEGLKDALKQFEKDLKSREQEAK